MNTKSLSSWVMRSTMYIMLHKHKLNTHLSICWSNAGQKVGLTFATQ